MYFGMRAGLAGKGDTPQKKQCGIRPTSNISLQYSTRKKKFLPCVNLFYQQAPNGQL